MGSTGATCPTEVDGDLTITDATDLSTLTCLTSITGTLRINDTSLGSFSELANLASVGGNVQIIGNSALTSLDGLAGLTEIKGAGSYGQLTLSGNPLLKDLDGLSSLTTVDYLLIAECDALTDLSGLQGPLAGEFSGGWGLALVNNDALMSLDSLANASNLTFRVYLSENPQLSDISALELVLKPETSAEIYIRHNPVLLDLVGLQNIATSVGVVIDDNDSLQDLQGLNGLHEVDNNLLISNNAKLASLSGLDSLESAYIVQIEGNPELITLAGAPSLKTIQHSLSIGYCGTSGNDSLASLAGLESIESIPSLGIQSNATLHSLGGLDSLTALDKLWVQFNPLLPSKAAFDLASSLNAVAVICDNLNPEDECMCQEWIPE